MIPCDSLVNFELFSNLLPSTDEKTTALSRNDSGARNTRNTRRWFGGE
jgi:hypothetical protein